MSPEGSAPGALRSVELPRFQPRPPWIGGDLQTLRNSLRPFPDLSGWCAERLILPLPDGDRLLGLLQKGYTERPLVLLLHGLTGSEASHYVRATTAVFLSAGWSVLRLNLRGAGPSGPLCRQGYHSGRSEDLRLALQVLRRSQPHLLERGVIPVGYSLGGNIVLKMLGEGGLPVAVPAAASVSAPIDLAEAQRCLMRPRNALYQRYLLNAMRAELFASAQPLTEEERRAAEQARTVLAFDDALTAPRNGFAGALDYYARSSALPLLGRIAVPTLLMHAEDDPWIPVEAYRSPSIDANPNLTRLLAPGGGHVGFHGRGSLIPWHDRCLLRFFSALVGAGPAFSLR